MDTETGMGKACGWDGCGVEGVDWGEKGDICTIFNHKIKKRRKKNPFQTPLRKLAGLLMDFGGSSVINDASHFFVKVTATIYY